jgi:hypothetical protein
MIQLTGLDPVALPGLPIVHLEVMSLLRLRSGIRQIYDRLLPHFADFIFKSQSDATDERSITCALIRF